jgi:hypothetical protein
MPTEEIMFFARSTGAGLLATGIAYLTGRLLLRLLGLRCDRGWEEFSCSTAAGLGCIALGAFALGTAGVLTRVTSAVLLALLLLVSLIPRHAPDPFPVREKGDDFRRTAAVVIFCFSLPLLLLPLYPPTGPDSITYHLAVAWKFARSGAVTPTPEFRYAVFPELAEMLFASALLLGNDITTQCVSLLALAVTAAAVTAYVRRVSGKGAGLWGAGLLLGNSALLLLGAVAYGDMILTAFVSIALFSFERWRGGGGDRWLTFTGLMTGCAAGTKYSALFFVPVLLAMIAAGAGVRRALRPAMIFLLPMALCALPWYLFNLYHTGNPFWPFFSGLFGLKYWNGTDVAAQTSDLLSVYGSGKGVDSLIALPWNLFAHPEMFHTEGSLSWLLLGAAPLAFVATVQDRSARRLALVTAAYTIFWFFTAQILRYLVPVVPLYCAVAAAGAGRLMKRFLPPGILPAAGATLSVALFIVPVYLALHIEGTAGFPPSTQAGRDRYLGTRLPSYGAVRFLNSVAGSDYTLYSYHDPQMAYFSRGKFRGDFFGPWRYSRFEAGMGVGEQALLDTLNAMGATYLLLRDDSSASGCSEEWLTRRFVVPLYRSPAVALFRVSSAPLRASYGPDLVSPADTAGFGNPGEHEVRFPVTEGTLYYCACTGSSRQAYANAALVISWRDDGGAQIRSDESPGIFLPESSVLRLMSTAPPHASTARLSLSRPGESAPSVARVSACEIRFVPDNP